MSAKRVLLALLGLSIAGCGGTTHHFLAPRALEKKEWMISVTWHHDLNKLTRPKLMPDLNAHVGIGNDYNFGFGYQFPIFCSHLTFAHYDDAGRGDLWSEYIILNRPFGMNVNPYFEIGASYADHRSGFYHKYSAGLSYGYRQPMPFFMIWDKYPGRPDPPPMRLMPVVKYELAGQDVGLSLVHYFGITSSSLADLRRLWLKGADDTVLVLKNSDIEYITPRQGDHFVVGRSSGHSYTIKVSPSATSAYADSLIHVWDQLMRVDQIGDPDAAVEYWLPGDTRIYRFLSGDELRVWPSHVIVDMEDVRRRWQAGEDIVITRYPQEILDRTYRPNSLIGDNSIGIGLIYWDMPED